MPVQLIDLKPRSDDRLGGGCATTRWARCAPACRRLAQLGAVPADAVARIAARVTMVRERARRCRAMAEATVLFEGVPETLDGEARRAGARVRRSGQRRDHCIDHLDHPGHRPAAVRDPSRAAAQRPLAEPGLHHSAGRTERARRHRRRACVSALGALLQGIGKRTVVCGPAPGFIVPRLQALIMNEAARMVEEGVATAEDIDQATRYGLGLRFAAIGVVEFIDFGGNDILYHASRYLSGALSAERYTAPADRRHDDGRGPQRPEERPGLLRLPRHRRRRPTVWTCCGAPWPAETRRPVQTPRHRLTHPPHWRQQHAQTHP